MGHVKPHADQFRPKSCFPTFCTTQNCPVSLSSSAVDKSIVTSATAEAKHSETRSNIMVATRYRSCTLGSQGATDVV